MPRSPLYNLIPDFEPDDETPKLPPDDGEGGRPNLYEEMLSGVPTTPVPESLEGDETPKESEGEEISPPVANGKAVQGKEPKRTGKGKQKWKYPPPERQCKSERLVSGGGIKRCTRWQRKIEDNVFSPWCCGHDPDPENQRKLREQGSKAGKASAKSPLNAVPPKPLKLVDVLRGPVKTQDDVEKARLAAILACVSEAVIPQRIQVVLQGLKDVSQHIERYGAVTGAEGGHSYMRLIPGVTITEWQNPQDAILDAEDVEKVDAGIMNDVKNGVQVPSDFGECVERYLHRKVRKSEKSRYAT